MSNDLGMAFDHQDSFNTTVKIVEIEGEKYLQVLSKITNVKTRQNLKDGKPIGSPMVANVGKYVHGHPIPGMPLSLRYYLYTSKAGAKSSPGGVVESESAVSF